MTVILKHISNNNINFFFISLKINNFTYLRFLSFFKDYLDELFFLDSFFFFKKKKGDFFYIKIIFFFLNILQVKMQFIRHFSNFLQTMEWSLPNSFLIKKSSSLTVKKLSYLLTKKFSNYSLEIFDLTKNFQVEHKILLSLVKIKEKSIQKLNSLKDTLLPIINFSSSFFKNSTNILYYLIKIYFFRNDNFFLKKILENYDVKFDMFSKELDNLGPRIFFYEYLKKNFNHILNTIYIFYLDKFMIHDQLVNYFLYVFNNAKKKKILKYFKFDEPNIYLEVYVPSVKR